MSIQCHRCIGRKKTLFRIVSQVTKDGCPGKWHSSSEVLLEEYAICHCKIQKQSYLPIPPVPPGPVPPPVPGVQCCPGVDLPGSVSFIIAGSSNENCKCLEGDYILKYNGTDYVYNDLSGICGGCALKIILHCNTTTKTWTLIITLRYLLLPPETPDCMSGIQTNFTLVNCYPFVIEGSMRLFSAHRPADPVCDNCGC